MGLKTWLSWSSGKDSYASLRKIWSDGNYEVECLFTVVDAEKDRIPMHTVSVDLLKNQVKALGIQHRVVELSGREDDTEFLALLSSARDNGVNCFVFGDLYLEEFRRYREQKMVDTGIGVVFPIWDQPPEDLVLKAINDGMRAIITSIDLAKLPASFLGSELSVDLVKELVELGCDPCGENGEYHSFVFDGLDFPRFR